MSDNAASARPVWTALLLLWLSGTALRLTILAVPPVIPLIHDDLHLSATQVGILTGLPSLLFAAAAVPGSLLIARTGIATALVVGLALAAIGGALRGAITDLLWLYTTTIVMGAGVAIMQVTLPPTVRAWVPQRIGFATAIYTNGLLIGEILPVALMLPVVLPLAGTWQRGFAFWSVPVAIIAMLVLIFAPRANPKAQAPGRRWWPDWSDPLIWRLGLMLGTANAMYFAINAFLPDFLTAGGMREAISPALTALNVGQLPASFLLLAFARQMELRVWPFAGLALLCLGAIAAIVFGNASVVVAGAALAGFAIAATLILTLILPPLLAPPDDVHRVTAAMFTISYSCAVAVPVVSGAIWDLSGKPALAFVPIAFAALLLMLLSPAIRQVKPYGS